MQLSSLEPGRLPLDIFNEIARLTVTPVLELVPFYREPSSNKVLLLQRSSKDALWPNMYHVPGTVLMATDQPGSFRDAIERACLKIKDCSYSNPIFVSVKLYKVARGLEAAIIYATELTELPKNPLLYNYQSIPENMIEGQAEIIKTAFENLNVFSE